MDESVEVLLGYAVLADNVKRYYTKLVGVVDRLVEQDRRYVAHVVLYALPLRVRAHREVLGGAGEPKGSRDLVDNRETGAHPPDETQALAYLFDLAEFVDVPLVPFHAVLGEVEVRRVFAQLFLVLGHLFDHLREVSHALLVPLRHPLGFGELLQILRHVSGGASETEEDESSRNGAPRLFSSTVLYSLRDDGDVLVPQVHPQLVVLVQQDLLLRLSGRRLVPWSGKKREKCSIDPFSGPFLRSFGFSFGEATYLYTSFSISKRS